MHICMYICIFPPGVLLVFVLTAYSKAISLYVLKFVSPHKLSAEVRKDWGVEMTGLESEVGRW